MDDKTREDLSKAIDNISSEFANDLIEIFFNHMPHDVDKAREEGEAEGYRVARLNQQHEEQALESWRDKLEMAKSRHEEVEISTTTGEKYSGIVTDVENRLVTIRPNMQGLVREDTVHIAAIIHIGKKPQVD